MTKAHSHWSSSNYLEWLMPDASEALAPREHPLTLWNPHVLWIQGIYDIRGIERFNADDQNGMTRDV